MYTSSSVESTQLSDWVLSALLLPICVYGVMQGPEITVFDASCMLVFDIGRVLAGSIAAPLTHMGGAFALLALPALLVAYFSSHGYRLGVQVFLLWLGLDLLFLGRTAMQIEGRPPSLLNTYQFDLHAMLSYVDLAGSATVIGHVLFMLGTVAFFTLLILPLFVTR